MKMGSTTCVDGVRQKYIIHKIKPLGLVAARNAKTDEERLIYLVPHHGLGYDTNNSDVWNEIQICCIRTM